MGPWWICLFAKFALAVFAPNCASILWIHLPHKSYIDRFRAELCVHDAHIECIYTCMYLLRAIDRLPPNLRWLLLRRKSQYAVCRALV